MAIHSSGQTVFNLTHIERITLDAGEKVDGVAGGIGQGGSSINVGSDKELNVCIILLAFCEIVNSSS